MPSLLRKPKVAPVFFMVNRLDEHFPELAGFNFWSDDGHYNVVGNRNAKELMTDPRIITLLNVKDRLKAAANKSQ